MLAERWQAQRDYSPHACFCLVILNSIVAFRPTRSSSRKAARLDSRRAEWPHRLCQAAPDPADDHRLLYVAAIWLAASVARIPATRQCVTEEAMDLWSRFAQYIPTGADPLEIKSLEAAAGQIRTTLARRHTLISGTSTGERRLKPPSWPHHFDTWHDNILKLRFFGRSSCLNPWRSSPACKSKRRIYPTRSQPYAGRSEAS
jgi:hypothetical protein